VKVDVKKVGAGPEIAGYSTVHYTISAQDIICQDVYVSTKAMKDIASKNIMKYMQEMSETDMEETGNASRTPCDYADQGVDYVELGFPMRTMYIERNQAYEVTAIQLHATLPAGGFELPEGMQIMDMGQMMDMIRGMQPPQP
jgi:hypothetical protein